MKKQDDANEIIDLIAVTDEDLITITGGRDYGWRGGGWERKPRPDGQTGPTAGPLGRLP
jgi:hypothetical protein